MSSQDTAGNTQEAGPERNAGPARTPPDVEGPKQSGGRWALLASAGFFCLYAANVLSGKISTVSDVTIPLNLGDVGEFITLFAAAICFVIATLRREAAN